MKMKKIFFLTQGLKPTFLRGLLMYEPKGIYYFRLHFFVLIHFKPILFSTMVNHCCFIVLYEKKKNIVPFFDKVLPWTTGE